MCPYTWRIWHVHALFNTLLPMGGFSCAVEGKGTLAFSENCSLYYCIYDARQGKIDFENHKHSPSKFLLPYHDSHGIFANDTVLKTFNNLTRLIFFPDLASNSSRNAKHVM